MSKGGGAGKVYFVLYLAVVLELLIIIVERDEAEEGLLRKQKETMKIVESILSQLQSGAGTEGINTRPQDEITLLSEENRKAMGERFQIKESRKYIVEVGVTDISADLKPKEGENPKGKEYALRLKKLVELANVEELDYQIFYNPSEDPERAPLFYGDDSLRKLKIDFSKMQANQIVDGPEGAMWEYLSQRKLKLDKDKTYDNIDLDNLTPESIVPVYYQPENENIGELYKPPDCPVDSVFYYSTDESSKRSITGEFKKRAFVVSFQPPQRAGWYKLRFSSRTNRILGVRSDQTAAQLSAETTVNIGTVQLTVGALEKVKKELISKLEKYNLPDVDILTKYNDLERFDEDLKKAKELAIGAENAAELRSKIDLYGYIAKLLAPGQSVNFSQNRGSIEFNIRVVTPEPPPTKATVVFQEPKLFYFDKIPADFKFTISPYQGSGSNRVSGRVLDKRTGQPIAGITCTPLTQINPNLYPEPERGKEQEYLGMVDKSLPEGVYLVEITHSIGAGAPAIVNRDLQVFKSELEKSSALIVENHINKWAFYGYNIQPFEAIPSSGNTIDRRNFIIYLSTDKNQQQPKEVNGLSLTTDDMLYLPADADYVYLSIKYRDPYLPNDKNRIIDIFPEKKFEIKQEEAYVSASPIVRASGTKKTVKLEISGIILTKPLNGTENTSSPKSADVKLNVKSVQVNVDNYEMVGDPILSEEGEGQYKCYLEIEQKSSGGSSRQPNIEGSIVITLETKATNPVNKSKTASSIGDVSVMIDYTPSRRSGGR